MKNTNQVQMPMTPQGTTHEAVVTLLNRNHEPSVPGDVEDRIRILWKTAIVAGVVLTLMSQIVGLVGFHQVWAGFPIGMTLGLISFNLLIKTTPDLKKPDYWKVGQSVFISFTKLAGMIFCIWLASKIGISVPQILGGILLSQGAVMIAFMVTGGLSKSHSGADEYARS